MNKLSRWKQSVAVLAILALAVIGAHAEGASAPSMTGVVTAAETLFMLVAGLAVTMAGFWITFRVAKKIRG